MSIDKKEDPHVVSRQVGLIPDNGTPDIDIFDIARQKDGHFACPKCIRECKDGNILANPWFFVEMNDDGTWTLVCKQCDKGNKVSLVQLKEPYGLVIGQSFTRKGVLRCPECSSPQFALIKSSHYVSLGCRRCSWQAIGDLSQTQGGLYVAN